MSSSSITTSSRPSDVLYCLLGAYGLSVAADLCDPDVAHTLHRRATVDRRSDDNVHRNEPIAYYSPHRYIGARSSPKGFHKQSGTITYVNWFFRYLGRPCTSRAEQLSIDYMGFPPPDDFTFVRPHCRGIMGGKEKMRVVYGGSLVQSLEKSFDSFIRVCKK